MIGYATKSKCHLKLHMTIPEQSYIKIGNKTLNIQTAGGRIHNLHSKRTVQTT
jgi:hypothetical protein